LTVELSENDLAMITSHLRVMAAAKPLRTASGMHLSDGGSAWFKVFATNRGEPYRELIEFRAGVDEADMGVCVDPRELSPMIARLADLLGTPGQNSRRRPTP
jgi:hypothetical protein